MSAHRAAVRLTPEADQDFLALRLYTRRAWGEAQEAAYRAAIVRAFEMLRQHPHAGRPRDELFSGCRTVQVEQHVVYYHLPREGEVEVLRILHRRQNPDDKVEEPHFEQ